MRPRPAPAYLAGYPPHLQQQVLALIEQGRFGAALLRRYPQAHAVRSDSALYDYVQALKAEHMRSAPPLGKVRFDNTLHVIRNALGTHPRKPSSRNRNRVSPSAFNCSKKESPTRSPLQAIPAPCS